MGERLARSDGCAVNHQIDEEAGGNAVLPGEPQRAQPRYQERRLNDEFAIEAIRDPTPDEWSDQAAHLDKGEKKTAINESIQQGTGLGVQGTPGFFINGKFLGGAFPFEYFKEIIDKEIAGQGSSSCADYSENLQSYCDENGKKSFNPVSKNIDPDKAPSIGIANGKVTVVEFSDFECPYCARAFSTVKQILKTYPNDVKFYYEQFPLTNIHPNSEKAAEASLCAQEQGKFWEYHDKLFTSQGATNQ